MATMMRPLVALALFLWTLAAALLEQPVCLNTDGGACGDDIKNDVQDSPQPECALWFYDYWVLAGKDYAKNETVGFQDVVVPFHQHDRRAFPLWGRYNYFRQVPNKPYDFLFAPALLFPLECHHSVPNLHLLDPIDTESFAASTGISPPVLTDNIMKKGDPFVLPCLDPAHTTEDFVLEIPTLTDEVLQSDGFCLDMIETRPSSEVPGTTLGAFARQAFAEGDVVMQGTALHMHRSELYNAREDTHEELLNYCYGHPDTDLLLLPLAPVVNSINHASAEKANVAIAWDMAPSELAEVFYSPTRIAFGDSEDTKLNIVFVATREIQPGEELFMDYGAEWTKAWEERDESKPFRHEIGFDLFPADWLAKEERGADFPAFATPKLAPGEAAPLQLVSGEILTEHIHRIGLPEGLNVKLAEWAEEIGITDIMRKFMFGHELAIDGQERVRINGGNWWLKRFDNSWQSNLFYITPDDDEANEQFMHALGRVGWDQVLEGMGKKFGVKNLSNFYPSFIALTQSQFSFMHSDSDYSKIWNVIFPVVQSNTTNSAGVQEAELNLGRDEHAPGDPLNVPYKYEPDHAVALGLNGMHGTAPGDYRGTGDFRMVASIYMGDFTDEKMLDSYVAEWFDPPYPRRHKLRDALRWRVHWHADDPKFHCGLPQVKV